MINSKKQFKKILGLSSIGILLTGIIVGLSIKGKDNSSQTVVKLATQNSQTNNNGQMLSQAPKFNSPKQICNNPLEEDESSVILQDYDNANKVDCVFAGCGGLY